MIELLLSISKAVVKAITNLEYGGIVVNEMPLTDWFNPYLTWGGNEEGVVRGNDFEHTMI